MTSHVGERVGVGELQATPIADALIELGRKDVVSFHALPVSRAASLADSALHGKYVALYGATYLDAEVTYSSGVLDSPVIPSGMILESERITARAFGASASLYVTNGTTGSNRAVISAVCRPGDRVLADRTCHQSVHFALSERRAQVDYVDPVARCVASDRVYVDARALVAAYRRAAESGAPYRFVIINGISYDGVCYDLQRVLGECLAIDDSAVFLVDEAWASAAHFHPYYRRFSAMNVANELAERYPRARIIATQSAHKSLSSLRQASYIHIFGDDDLITRVKMARFATHTTSPSYPILASLELARAQAVREAEGLLDRAFGLSAMLTSRLATDPRLAGYRVNDASFIAEADLEHVLVDPLRISIDVSAFGTPDDFRAVAFREDGIYVNRTTQHSILINLHIGVRAAAVERLIGALISYRRAKRPARQPAGAGAQHPDGGADAVSASFLIEYPPGVPLLVPGERVVPALSRRIDEAKRCGNLLIEIHSNDLGAEALL